MNKIEPAKSAHCCCVPSNSGCSCVLRGTYLLRLALGGMLLFMSINKFSGGLSAFVDNMSAIFAGSILPMVLVKTFLTITPFVEGVLGALILLGLFTRIATWVAGLLFALYAVGITATGNQALSPEIAYNFVYLFGALFLAKKSMKHDKISLDHLLCGGKCERC
ncbi:DoxX family protein [Candidatus Peregrinibacteria bacterium]|nr:DoxX family protein [Candidatus Peregrinibacteria bacterium]